MPIAVHLIELSYILLVFISLIYYRRKGLPLWEGIFLFLIIFSPYSISIIPFRQDTFESYGIYNNSDILNFVNFYKIAGLSILDILAVILIIKNINSAFKLPIFFKRFYLTIIILSVISYSISSTIFWSPELDSYIRLFSVLKSIVYVISIYSVIDKICFCMGLNDFLRMLANIIFLYCITNAILLNFLPDWYTWVKYSFNYLFLDQTDQFIVFLYCVLAIWGPLSSQHRYKLYSLILCMILVLSGGKAGIYSLLILIFAWCYDKIKISSASLNIVFFGIILLSWLISCTIGMSELDISIYTRYFQVKQLLINYENNLQLLFFGIGPSKAYLFYDTPVIFDSGAYTIDELNSKFKLAFQMPYLSWLKNYGLFGFGLLLILINYISKTAWTFKLNRVSFAVAIYALGLYFVLVGFMDFPSFGLKTIIPISLYIYLVRCGVACNKKEL